MRLAVAALAALAAAVLELSVGPHFGVGDAHPQLVLVLGVVATVVIGPVAGLAWAFAGGLTLDVLAGRPLGATAFTLLVVLAAAGLGARAPSRFKAVAAIGLVPICSASNAALLVAVLGVVGASIVAPDAVSLLSGMAYDTVVAIVVVPVAMLAVGRRAQAAHLYA